MAIFKKQGVYWIDYYFKGLRKREKIGASYKLAQDVLHKRKLEIAEKRFFPERQKQTITFKQFADKYWEAHGKFLRSSYTKYLHEAVKEIFGDKRLNEITTFDFQQFYSAKLEETTPSTANRYRDHVHAMFQLSIEWGDLIGENPITKIKKHREENHRLRFLSKEEMERLLDKSNSRLYPVLVCALMTGMRKGEILGLRWENVNLEQMVIYILKSKSGKPREIPITSKFRDTLITLGPKKTGSVFELPDISLRRFFSKALRDAKITEFRFHDLRHTFASHFLMKTCNLPALQNLLGHSSPKMTQRYAHLAKGHLISEMQIFDSSMPISSLDRHPDGHQAENQLLSENAKAFVS